MLMAFIHYILCCLWIYASGLSINAAYEPVCISEPMESYGEKYITLFRRMHSDKPRNEWPFQFGDSELLGYLREIPVNSNDESLNPVFEELSKHFKKSAPIKILEVGCGSGSLSFELLTRYPLATIVTSDINAEVVTALPKNARITPIVFDATQVDSFPINTTFDAIVSVGAVRYFKDQQAIKNFTKLLNPNGLALFVDYCPFVGGQKIGLRNVAKLTSFYILLHLYKTDPLFKKCVDSQTAQFHKTLLQIAGSTNLEAYAIMVQKTSEKEELVEQLLVDQPENINTRIEMDRLSKVSCLPQPIGHLIVDDHYKN